MRGHFVLARSGREGGVLEVLVETNGNIRTQEIANVRGTLTKQNNIIVSHVERSSCSEILLSGKRVVTYPLDLERVVVDPSGRYIVGFDRNSNIYRLNIDNNEWVCIHKMGKSLCDIAALFVHFYTVIVVSRNGMVTILPLSCNDPSYLPNMLIPSTSITVDTCDIMHDTLFMWSSSEYILLKFNIKTKISVSLKLAGHDIRNIKVWKHRVYLQGLHQIYQLKVTGKLDTVFSSEQPICCFDICDENNIVYNTSQILLLNINWKPSLTLTHNDIRKCFFGFKDDLALQKTSIAFASSGVHDRSELLGFETLYNLKTPPNAHEALDAMKTRYICQLWTSNSVSVKGSQKQAANCDVLKINSDVLASAINTSAREKHKLRILRWKTTTVTTKSDIDELADMTEELLDRASEG